ncbi:MULTISPECIES: hypothetical protein [unclassified Pseudomonas]|uniref:hypothetical protein n=1 Tax=unclassified Pseudomonas TaxID=196821 RepID=UPI0023601EC4|nr:MULTISPECIES: hypothetical protein [unclassified Pseudomonas]
MKITFQHITTVTNIALIIAICWSMSQSNTWQREFKESINQLTLETQRNLTSLQSRLENKINNLNESLDTYQSNTSRSLRILEQRVENIERRPAVIMNGYQGYKNSGNQNNHIQ